MDFWLLQELESLGFEDSWFGRTLSRIRRVDEPTEDGSSNCGKQVESIFGEKSGS